MGVMSYYRLYLLRVCVPARGCGFKEFLGAELESSLADGVQFEREEVRRPSRRCR